MHLQANAGQVMEIIEKPFEPCGALLMDRFVHTADAGWLDLATDRRVCLAEHTESFESDASWLDRCGEVASQWSSHVAPLIDYAVIAGRRIEAHAWSGQAPRTQRTDARRISLDLVSRPALDAVAALIEADEPGPLPLRVASEPGAGLTTFLDATAAIARRRGVAPICPAALRRAGNIERLVGRTLVLLADAAETAESVAAALALTLRHELRVLAVVGRHVGERDAVVDLGRLPFHVLRRAATLHPSPAADAIDALVRDSDGIPGRLVTSWLGTGVDRVSYRRRMNGRASLHAAAIAPLPVTQVAEGGARWGEPRASADGSAHVDGFLASGLAALDAARLDVAEAHLRTALCIAGPRDEGRARVLLMLARCLVWQGRTVEAAAMLTRVNRQDVSQTDFLCAQAQVASVRQPAAALARLARALDGAADIATRGFVHVESAPRHARIGDRVAASAHLAHAVRALRRVKSRALATAIRLAALETMAIGRVARTPRDRAVDQRWVRRAATRLARRDVPRFVRVRAARALEELGWKRTREVDAFVTRWGEEALWPPTGDAAGDAARAGDVAMVTDLQAVLEICRDADDPHAALERVSHCLRQRLHAAAVAVHAGPDDARRLALAGSARLSTMPLAQRVSESGVPAAIAIGDAGAEGGAPIAYGGRTIGALICRWPLAPPVEVRDADTLLAASATAAAPHVQNLLDRARLRDEALELDLGLLGSSAGMTTLREQVRRAALAPFHVLIEGESGSGKEIVARAVHAAGPRRRRRFCALNCAALADELVEAELFGHARGAYTGAVAERPGLFEDADGGTLFLDEVGELSPRAQAKLLRVIQDGEVRRVGENVSRRIDARLVAATNRPLREEAAAGRFRADLFYRLDVIRIAVPPLRDRPEDIVLLARAFWRDATQRLASRATLHPGALAALARYHWPGNVRELQNVVMALAVNGPARGAVTAARLPAAIAMQAEAAAALTLDAARRSFEERFVRSALARAGNQPGRAARDLGLTRQGLRKLLVRLRIEITLDGVDVRTSTS